MDKIEEAETTSESRLLTDDEIRKVLKQANDEAQEYGDDDKPLPERAVAKAQDVKTDAYYKEKYKGCVKLAEDRKEDEEYLIRKLMSLVREVPPSKEVPGLLELTVLKYARDIIERGWRKVILE